MGHFLSRLTNLLELNLSQMRLNKNPKVHRKKKLYFQNFRWFRNRFLQRFLFLREFRRTIPLKKRVLHIAIAGGTGSGKSELMKLFIKSDMESGMGALVIDPHSDLVSACNRLRVERKGKEIVLLSNRYGKQGWHFQYNVFEIQRSFKTDFEKEVYISHRCQQLVEAFATILSVDFTVNMRLLIYNVLMLLHWNEGMQLRDFLNCMRPETSEPYLKLVTNVPDRNVQLFFAHDFHKPDFKRTKLAVLNRFSSALGNVGLRTILDCKTSSFQLNKLLYSGAIILVDTYGLGSVGSSILGSFLVAEVFSYALSRGNVPAQFRKPIFLYLDECQRFMNTHVVSALQQARKFGLHLCLAFQDSGQFPSTSFGEALLSNTGVKICGSASYKDLNLFCKELPRTKVAEIPPLSRGRFLVKISEYAPMILTAHSFLVHQRGRSYLRKWQYQLRVQHQLRQYYRFLPHQSQPNKSVNVSKKSAEKINLHITSVL